jgi:membrane protease YdiL (CAAX protease family)
MSYDDHNPAGAAPVRARENEPHDDAQFELSLTPVEPPATERQTPQIPQTPLLPPVQTYASIPDDLRVPWGWREVALFVIVGLIAAGVVTRGLAEVAVRFFGANSNEMFGTAITTSKSVVVLVSQSILDAGAILFLYVMLLMRTSEPFWKSIGWREMRPGEGQIRHSALQFLAGGAVLALVITFMGGFFNSKETLPIEDLLQARVSVVLFSMLGILVAPLVEETIFRGFLYPVIARRVGIVAGIAITGTLFGLMHAAQLWGGWGQIGLLILVGVVLTWVRARTGTVAASYFVHLGYNGLQLVGYVIFVIGGGHH